MSKELIDLTEQRAKSTEETHRERAKVIRKVDAKLADKMEKAADAEKAVSDHIKERKQ